MFTFNTHQNELFVEHILCKDVAIFWQKLIRISRTGMLTRGREAKDNNNYNG